MNNFLRITSILLGACATNASAGIGQETETQLSFERPDNQSAFESQFYLGWESRYLSEGRDELDGDSLFIASFETSWKKLTAGVWYGESPDQSYNELQLALALNHSIGDFDFYVSYTHFQFQFDSSFDNEVGAGFTWNGLPLDIALSTDVYYSFDADGYFVEVAASREFEINDRLALSLTVPFGINQGYVPDGHDGANNITLQLGAEYALSDSITLSAHTTYSWDLERDSDAPGDELLRDFFHAGVGLSYSF